VGLLGGKTRKFKDSKGEVISDSIAELNKITLGGIEQYILIRGKNKNNPVILFLHGGPGSAQIGFIARYQKNLENEFIVVNWDQRGAGKSYSKNIPSNSMTLAQFISDSKELVEYLCTRFAKEKIYIVGHSWGSLLGSRLTCSYSERIIAYIGIGQVVNMNDNELISYKYVLEEARKANKKGAVKVLEKIGEPPYKNQMKDLRIQRKWLNKFKGAVYEKKLYKEIMGFLLTSPEYSFLNILNWVKGSSFSLKHLWSELLAFDITKDAPEIRVPVYFCIGRYDYNTPFELSYKYYETLKAPHKEYIWFERSAHSPIFEEPEKFCDTIVRIKKEIEAT